MKKYVGMNFKEWCALDEDDKRTMNLLLRTECNAYHFTSNEEIIGIDMLMLVDSTIEKIDLVNNEWFIELRL